MNWLVVFPSDPPPAIPSFRLSPSSSPAALEASHRAWFPGVFSRGGMAVPTATSEPTPDPYPAGLVWINRPVGIQCQEGFLPGYGSLGEAVSTMRAAGVSIVAFEEVTLAVPDECGGPTAEHFRLQISAEDAAAAASMGWTLEEE